jgi:hypothetical protein
MVANLLCLQGPVGSGTSSIVGTSRRETHEHAVSGGCKRHTGPTRSQRRRRRCRPPDRQGSQLMLRYTAAKDQPHGVTWRDADCL